MYRYRHVLAMLTVIFTCAASYSQQLLPTPRYVPPEITSQGAEAHYRDLAVIETSCSNNVEIRELWLELVRQGALPAVISSPQRVLAWVPPSAQQAVRSARINSADGIERGVLSISTTATEFRANHALYNAVVTEENEADEAIVAFLDFIKSDRYIQSTRAMSDPNAIGRLQEFNEPMRNCVNPTIIDVNDTPRDTRGNKIFGGPGAKIMFASKAEGLIAHTSFFPESRTGTGTQNWDNTVYTRYRDFYLAGLVYWTTFAAKYGRTATSFWRLYGPTHSFCQVSGEPIVIKEDAFVSQIMTNIGVSTAFTHGSIRRAIRFCQPYNDLFRRTLPADQAICGFICYRGTAGAMGDTTGVWPHAESIIWGGVDLEGVYFAMDTMYGQAGLDPWRAPYRNVCAHEIGHLWGAPDEYNGPETCAGMYRGASNINCQANRPWTSPPGSRITGGEGIMVSNYTGGSSTVTPVHVGVLPSASASPVRCFSTQPAGDSLIIFWCGYDQRTIFTTVPLCMPLEYDFCMDVWAPSRRTIGGTSYLFDYWELRWQDGTTRTYTTYANRLPSSAFTSTKANPVVAFKAVYTNTPPDVFTANNTLSAQLAPADNSASPPRGISLKWINRWDMNRTQSKIEYDAGAGNWLEVTPALQPFPVDVTDWTGIFIDRVPAPGGATNPIAANTTYRFRLVGYFNTLRGAVSTTASLTTRPSTPPVMNYCYDAFEPNTPTSQTVIPQPDSSEVVEINAACPMHPRLGEFTWFTPKNDYYRIVINPGWYDVEIALVKKSGSYFNPKFRAQPALLLSHINSVVRNDTAYLRLQAGTYIIKVEPEIPTTPGYSGNFLVDPDRGYFGYGEYKLLIRNVPSFRRFSFIDRCWECYRLLIPRPDPAGFYLIKDPRNAIREAALRFDVFRKGVPGIMESFFDIQFVPNPGYQFSFFDGDFGSQSKNPFSLKMGGNPNTPPNDNEFYANYTKIPDGQVELVLVYPDGPDGIFERRVMKPIGSVESALANAPADYAFIGWGGDSVATTNPLPVTLWHNKRLIAYWKRKPCNPEPMTAWVHKLDVTTAKQNNTQLEFGMQTGAGDGLETGQPDLPPMPPSGVFEARWVNITGSQGSTIDHRAIQQSWKYIGVVQTGTGNTPVRMSWSPPTTIPASASMILKILADPAPIDMRTTTSYTFAAEGTYQFTIEVKTGCPEPTKPSDVTVTTTRVSTKNFPCIEMEVLVRSTLTGDPLPFYNPFNLRVYEYDANNQEMPAHVSDIQQRDTTFVFKICSDSPSSMNNPNPNRVFVIKDEHHDPDKNRDTVKIDIPIPAPQGSGNLVRFVQQRVNGWDLVSLPLDVEHTETPVIFSDPFTRLYEFNITTGVYDAAPAMAFGKGYWLNTSDPTTVFYGREKLNYIFSGLGGVGEPFGYGWNLIGSISRTIATGAITVTPSGGLLSIFGWNPATGYVVPTNIEPGKGFWVRVNPGTTLKMQATSIAGEQTDLIAYQKAMLLAGRAGKLIFTNEKNERRTLVLAKNDLDAIGRDALRLPQPPPIPMFDVRSATQTAFIESGMNHIALQEARQTTLRLDADANQEITCEIFDEQQYLIGVLHSKEHILSSLDLTSHRSLFLRVQMVDHSPKRFALDQNYPNPFSGSKMTVTTIPFSLTRDGRTRITLHDALGRRVKILFDGELKGGLHSIEWDGTNDRGIPLASGMYLIRLESNGQFLSRTLSLSK